jgi:hypothetical protein
MNFRNNETDKLLPSFVDLELENGYDAVNPQESTGGSPNRFNAINESIRANKEHTWLIPFFVNIFLACASFSIIRPSLAPYLLQIGAPLSFLPWVVSLYSVGEMMGSASIGIFYEYATRTYKVEGRGPRVSLLMCAVFGIVGSMLYAAAGWIDDAYVARQCILWGRFLQGIWTGGQQAVEQGTNIHCFKPIRFALSLLG